MTSDPVARDLLASPSAAGPRLVFSDTPRLRWGRRLDAVISFLFLLFPLALPFSVKGTAHVYKAAFLVWIVKLLVERRRPFPQELAAPMLAYVALSGISTILSPAPILSWDRMKIVGIILLAVLFAQNVKTIRQMKWIVGLLLFAAAMSAAVTGWQYLGGYGVEIANVPDGSLLAMAGIQSTDVVQSINGHGVHSPQALQKMVERFSAAQPLRVMILHSTPIQRFEVILTRSSFLGSGLLMPNAPLRRGKPLRPQGYFSHYAIYAEVMLQLGLLAWGLLLARRKMRGATRWLLAVVFLVTSAVVVATQTRSAIGAMLLGCFLVAMIAVTWKERAIGVGLLVVVIALTTVWIERTRGMSWVDKRDPGTEFRVMMWQDALRLIPQHPLFGIGMATVREYWQQYDIRAYRIFPVRWHFHSDYLQLAVERGLPALAAWLWLAIAYLLLLWRVLPRARQAGWFPYGVVLGIMGGFLAFLAAGVVQYNLGEEQIDVVIWFYMGLILALDHILPARAQAPAHERA